MKATRLLTDPQGIGLSPRRITLSTAGIVPKIEELGREPVRPKLAVSLNASTEEQRRELMPITRKYSLKDLLAACKAYPLRPWEKLTFEYVLLKGVNDTDADARRVVRLLANLNAKVNLIALNPGPGIPFETPDAERVRAFQEIVRRSMPCFVRQAAGAGYFRGVRAVEAGGCGSNPTGHGFDSGLAKLRKNFGVKVGADPESSGVDQFIEYGFGQKDQPCRFALATTPMRPITFRPVAAAVLRPRRSSISRRSAPCSTASTIASASPESRSFRSSCTRFWSAAKATVSHGIEGRCMAGARWLIESVNS